MLTDLEKYLEEKRKSLDVESADDDRLWRNISYKLRERAGITRRSDRMKLPVRIMKFAAVAFILFSMGYIANDLINKRAIDRKVTLSDINLLLGQRENQYRLLVTMKTDEVKSFTNTDNLVIRELFEEIKKLDIVYDQSLKDLKEIGYDDRIINTIFDTYEMKIHLLELIILESNKSGSHENNGKINL